MSSTHKASHGINLPQLQNLIKRDPESYRDEVRIFYLSCIVFFNHQLTHVVGRAKYSPFS